MSREVRRGRRQPGGLRENRDGQTTAPSQSRQVWAGKHGLLPWQVAVRALLLVFAVIIAYWPVHKATYVWDDDQSILENRFLHVASGIKAIWLDPHSLPNEEHYWPINYTTLWLERQLVGERPAVSHWINVAVHILNGLLLWRLLAWLSVPGAWFAAMLFVLHPTRAEAVAWMLERNGLLATCLSLLCALSYFKFLADGSRRHQLLGVGWLVLALLSKAMAVGLPIALLVIWWWKRGRLTRGDVLRVLPLVVVTVVIAGFDFRVARGHGMILSGLTVVERLQLAGAEFWFYLGKWILPFPLIAVYPRWDVQGWHAGAWFFPVTAAAALWLLWFYRARIGKGPLAAVLTFGIFIGPVIGLVDFNYMSHSFVADRFAYLATAPLTALFAGGVVAGFDRLKLPAWIGWASGSIVCGLLGVLTYHRAATFENLHTFSADILRKNPNAWSALGNEANWMKAHGRLDDAIPLFKRAVELRPEVAVTHNCLGTAYAEKGERELARAEFEKAVTVEPGSPLAEHNLGLEYMYIGRYEEAAEHLRTAATILPDDAQIVGNYGAALGLNGKPGEAIRYLRRSIELDPANPAAFHALANAEYHMGELRDAIGHMREAIARKADEPEWINELAWYLATAKEDQLRKPAEAIELALRACEMTKRSDPSMLDTLAVSYAAAGRYKEALAASEEAVKLLTSNDDAIMASNIRKHREEYKMKAQGN